MRSDKRLEEGWSGTLSELAAVRALTASGAARSIRIAANVSLHEVAAAVPCSPSTVLRWERNQRRPHGDKGLAYGAILKSLMGSGRV
jgi:DNA-binding transcriptional regulator YiaG